MSNRMFTVLQPQKKMEDSKSAKKSQSPWESCRSLN